MKKRKKTTELHRANRPKTKTVMTLTLRSDLLEYVRKRERGFASAILEKAIEKEMQLGKRSMEDFDDAEVMAKNLIKMTMMDGKRRSAGGLFHEVKKNIDFIKEDAINLSWEVFEYALMHLIEDETIHRTPGRQGDYLIMLASKRLEIMSGLGTKETNEEKTKDLSEKCTETKTDISERKPKKKKTSNRTKNS